MIVTQLKIFKLTQLDNFNQYLFGSDCTDLLEVRFNHFQTFYNN